LNQTEMHSEKLINYSIFELLIQWISIKTRSSAEVVPCCVVDGHQIFVATCFLIHQDTQGEANIYRLKLSYRFNNIT